jgi:predicted phage tail protein
VSTDPASGPGAKHIEVAAAHADLGLPIPRGTRLRLVKRSMGRLMWAFGRHQSLYNHAMVEAVSELANAVEAMRTSIAEQVGNEVGSMRSQVGALEVEVRTATGRLEAAAAQLDELRAQVDELARRIGAPDTAGPGAPTRSG